MGTVETRFRVTIEVSADRNFSDRELMSNIKKIGKREAMDKLYKIIGCSPHSIRIIGEPKTIKIIFKEDL